MYAKVFKRTIDLLLALTGVVICMPIMLIIAVGVRLESKGPALFLQRRAGRNGKLFYIYKFRTMRTQTTHGGRQLSDMDRMTRFGLLLRKLSLDELPQLFNILRGEMSLIGPRPLLPEYLPYYSPEQSRRHDVLPGISGWAQVNGRNAISWDEKLNYDIWYTENISFLLDVRIFFLTIAKVFRRKGINNSTDDTMPSFIDHVTGKAKL